MPVPYASAVIPADAAAVWQAVRPFDALSVWHPDIAVSELEGDAQPTEIGAVRHLRLADGETEVRERLVAFDDTARSYTYEFVTSPFPVRSYRSTIRVAPVTDSGHSFVEWWAIYDADAADEAELTATFADGVYTTGLAGLTTHLGG